MTKRIWIGALLMAFVALTMTAHARWATRAGAGDAPGEMAPNEFGVAESVHRSGLIDRSNPFFPGAPLLRRDGQRGRGRSSVDDMYVRRENQARRRS